MIREPDPQETPLRVKFEGSGGGVYEATYSVAEAAPPPIGFDVVGAHSCMFCGSSTWSWVFEFDPVPAGAGWAHAPSAAACDTCHRMFASDEWEALIARGASPDGDDASRFRVTAARTLFRAKRRAR